MLAELSKGIRVQRILSLIFPRLRVSNISNLFCEFRLHFSAGFLPAGCSCSVDFLCCVEILGHERQELSVSWRWKSDWSHSLPRCTRQTWANSSLLHFVCSLKCCAKSMVQDVLLVLFTCTGKLTQCSSAHWVKVATQVQTCRREEGLQVLPGLWAWLPVAACL